MWLIRRILVPIDFSDASELALDRAIDLASQMGASVTVMHATTEEPDERLRAAVEALVAPRKNRGVELGTELRRGPAVSAVLETTNRLGANLIVVGSHGRRGVARRVLGSVAEEIVRLARIPVLVVHAYEGGERPPVPPFGVGHEAGVRQP
jgi:nucleotide-binding universal stress UspA family protein